ncbi:MAG: phosphate acyltransferase PlsX [Actinomycetota bacterium]
MLPVAIDAMGGDHAPAEIVAGAELCAEAGIPVVLVGQPDAIGDTSIEVIPASEAIPMDADPTKSVRTMKDSSMVRAAEAVRDERCSAMVSAGNTGAALAAATLRMKRIKGVARPAIATPVTNIGGGLPRILIDAGANVECTPDLLHLFGRMGAVYATARYGVEAPRVGLLANGEEASKGSPLTKAAFPLLSEDEWQEATNATFIGNVEGGDIFGDAVDVIVTDGFTGNVALKTLEGTAKTIIGALLAAFDSSDEARQGAELLLPALLPLYERANPDNVGGAALVGVNGVCMISHGSSSANAILNAVKAAAELVESDLVGKLQAALS